MSQLPTAPGKKKKFRKFKTKAEKDAFILQFLGEEMGKDQPPMSIPDMVDRDEGARFMRYRLDVNHKNPMAHRLLAPISVSRGDAKSAITHYMCAMEYNPADLDTINDFGLLMLKTGHTREAIKYLKRVVDANPRHDPGNKNLAAAYARIGQYREALRYAEMAAVISPYDPMVHRNLAKIRNECGNTIEAIKHNRCAIRLGPGMHAIPEKGDARAYRDLSLQLVSFGEREQGFAHEIYGGYRALSGKKFELKNSNKTKEILLKTNSAFA